MTRSWENIRQELNGIQNALSDSLRDEKAEIEAVEERHRIYREALREEVAPIDAQMKTTPPDNVYFKFLLASVQVALAKALSEKTRPRSSCLHLASITKWTGNGFEFVRVCEYCGEPVEKK